MMKNHSNPLAFLSLLLMLALFVGLTPVAWAAPGDLDPSFDDDGKALVDFQNYDDARAIALDNDGRILVAGQSSLAEDSDPPHYNDFAVARLTEYGALDPTFGDSGKVLLDFGRTETATELLLDDDTIVLGGYAGYRLADDNWSSDMAAVRLDPDGALVTSWGDGGKVWLDFGGYEQAYAAALDSAGRILLAGHRDYKFAVTRLNADGSLDTSFGVGGLAAVDLGGRAYGVAIDALGRIVVVGSAGGIAAIRLNASGTLDDSFGTGGVVIIPAGDAGYANAVVLDDNEDIVVAGSVGNWWDKTYVAAIRLSGVDGTLDASFGVDGQATVDFGGSQGYAAGLAFDSSGRIVLAGKATLPSGGEQETHAFAVARLSTGGALDGDFGDGGKATVVFGPDHWTYGYALALDAAARILVAGYTGSDGFDFAMARLLGGESYAWEGFYQPVDNPPVVNVAKAGAGVALKFSLGGDYGMDVIEAGYPRFVGAPCESSGGDAIEEYATNLGGLKYDPATGQYIYVWTTSKSYVGACGTLELKLTDGTLHTAEFRFR
jgi:uncharacterized delta-60 repeat protein